MSQPPNVKFLCNGCLSADIRSKSTMVVGELSKGIEDNKQSVEIIKSRPSCKPPQLEAKYSSVIKSSSDITQELINRILLSTMKK